MNKTYVKLSLMAMLATVVSGCQKETLTEVECPAVVVAEQNAVHYTIDGIPYSIVIYNDDEWSEFMKSMMSQSRNGRRVVIEKGNRDSRDMATKETLVYTTTDESSASKWTKEKVAAGYVVTMSYNEKTKEFICIAVR